MNSVIHLEGDKDKPLCGQPLKDGETVRNVGFTCTDCLGVLRQKEVDAGTAEKELAYIPTGDITADKAAAYMRGVLAELVEMPPQAKTAALNVVLEFVIELMKK